MISNNAIGDQFYSFDQFTPYINLNIDNVYENQPFNELGLQNLETQTPDPDAWLSFNDLAKEQGLKQESFEVTTSDGYKLNV